MELGKVGQVGIVVKDVEKAAEFLLEKFGIGPFVFIDFKEGKAVYKDREVAFKNKIGIAKYNDLVIELMQPYEGATIQNDPEYLPPGGQGLHHLGFFVEEAEKLAAEWEAQGGKVLQRSWPGPGALTIYLDTRDYSGILVELIQIGGGGK